MNKIYYKASLKKLENDGKRTVNYTQSSETATKSDTILAYNLVDSLLEDIYWNNYDKLKGVVSIILKKDRHTASADLNIEPDTIDYSTQFYNIFMHDNNLINVSTKLYTCDNLIFEIIESEDGFKYAKEIYTGRLFPIIRKKDIESKCTAHLDTQKEERYYSSKYFRYSFDVTYTPIFFNKNLARVEYIIFEKEMLVANTVEIEEYKNSFKKKTFFGKEKTDEDRISNINAWANSNTYNYDIVPRKEEKKEEKIKQSPTNLVMENIEILLFRLAKINPKLKREKEDKYNKMLESEHEKLTTTPLTIETLKAFEAELEYIVNYSKNDNADVLTTLENIVNEYYDGEKTPRTIDDIDKLSEIFLKMESTYNASIQRKAINLLSTIYIYEIYENKDTITMNDLCEGHYPDFIRTIALILNQMIDEGLIENNAIIQMDNISSEYILDTIKNIEFKKGNKKTLSLS